MIETFKLFHKPDDVIEIRTIGKVTSSGYFKDIELAVAEAKKHDGKANVYFVLNKINAACYHRENRDRIIEKASSTSDSDIDRREWILIDFDPKRASKVSSTNEEKALSEELMKKAGAYLKQHGFKSPVIADSGNGWHLLYRIDMPNDNESKKLVENFLKACDMLFSNDKVEVDISVFNASRITKLYGSMAVKGANTPERPHRRSAITFIPKSVDITDQSRIKAIAELLPKPKAIQGEFSIDDFIHSHNIRVLKTSNWDGGKRYILEQCPFDSAHGKDSAIIQLNSGALSFHCFHNGCAYNSWKELRELYEPESQRQKYEKKEYKPQEKKPLIVAPSVNKEIDPKTQEILNRANNLCEVRKIDRDSLETFTTGIVTLDKKLELMFGKLVVVSGTNGSGKSTILGQLMLESLEQNFNVFTYSGELLDSEFQYWIDLQAAGMENLTKKVSKKGKEFFDIKPMAMKQIHEWYKDRFYLYKNNESMQFKDILDVVEAFRIHRNCRVIFLDNFLTMDISDLDDKELKAQTIFINSLANYAKSTKTLIFLVIHPKKIYKGICTKGDVLGSGNLTNAIDYLFLVHRNNEAWKTAMKDRMIGSDTKEYLLMGTNILEVSKDRWTGAEGLNVPLMYFEDSKRLIDINNLASKDKKYSWDKTPTRQKEFWEE